MARMLVIEDDDDVRSMLAQVLGTAGHSVVEAQNGEEAIRFLKNQPFDLVIVDILVPEKDGFEIIHEMKKTLPEVKIIAISGAPRFGFYNPLEAAEIFGAHRTVSKPFGAVLILKVAEELLSAV